MRRVAALVAGVLGAGLAWLPLGAKAEPCPSAVCADADSCRRDASWVIEGRVLEYAEGGFGSTCRTTFPVLRQACSSSKEAPAVLLDHAVEVRGRTDLVAAGMATLNREKACPVEGFAQTGPVQQADPGSLMVGGQYRFYGFDARPGSTSGGAYVIAEPVTGSMHRR